MHGIFASLITLFLPLGLFVSMRDFVKTNMPNVFAINGVSSMLWYHKFSLSIQLVFSIFTYLTVRNMFFAYKRCIKQFLRCNVNNKWEQWIKKVLLKVKFNICYKNMPLFKKDYIRSYVLLACIWGKLSKYCFLILIMK